VVGSFNNCSTLLLANGVGGAGRNAPAIRNKTDLPKLGTKSSYLKSDNFLLQGSVNLISWLL
jgi:hypothetical protein